MPGDLDGLDALIIPGGESTVMTLGIEREGLAEPLRELAGRGTPVLGTCAGHDHARPRPPRAARHPRRSATRSAVSCARSRPISSSTAVDGGPVHAVFIRARGWPSYGPEVEVLASVDGHPVAVRQGNLLAVAFHPELAGETRLHELLLGRRATPAEDSAPRRRRRSRRLASSRGTRARRPPSRAAGTPSGSGGGCSSAGSSPSPGRILRRRCRATARPPARDHDPGRRRRARPAPRGG